MFPTREEALCPQVADAETQDGQLVQAGDDILGEGQQAGQAVQLRVQAVAVALGRVGLSAFGRRRFDSGYEQKNMTPNPNRGVTNDYSHYRLTYKVID